MSILVALKWKLKLFTSGDFFFSFILKPKINKSFFSRYLSDFLFALIVNFFLHVIFWSHIQCHCFFSPLVGELKLSIIQEQNFVVVSGKSWHSEFF